MVETNEELFSEITERNYNLRTILFVTKCMMARVFPDSWLLYGIDQCNAVLIDLIASNIYYGSVSI